MGLLGIWGSFSYLSELSINSFWSFDRSLHSGDILLVNGDKSVVLEVVQIIKQTVESVHFSISDVSCQIQVALDRSVGRHQNLI